MFQRTIEERFVVAELTELHQTIISNHEWQRAQKAAEKRAIAAAKRAAKQKKKWTSRLVIFWIFLECQLARNFDF